MISVEQRIWTEANGWSEPVGKISDKAQLVLVFGDRKFVEQPELYAQVSQFYPDSYIVSLSTAGNIMGDNVSSDSVVLSAFHFEKTKLWYAETSIENEMDSDNVGKKLAEFLPMEGLVHSLVFSDGLHVNGSALARSINKHLPAGVTVTGGLAGDGELFEETLVSVNGKPVTRHVVLVGLYGTSLEVGYASKGGWSKSDHSYVITRSKGNVLYELSGEPALAAYKKLLGEKASGLPSSALLYPFQLDIPEEGNVVRTILSVNEADQSITFAGDMPEGNTVNSMQASEDELISSARSAGELAMGTLSVPAQATILVSCVGRRLVLKDRAREEIIAVKEAVGTAPVCGFYSYGELCPVSGAKKQCLLHNQTMTITVFAER